MSEETVKTSQTSPVEGSARRERGPNRDVLSYTLREDRSEQQSNASTGEVSKVFPPNFLWGAATAAYQVEGGIENTDWAEAARKAKVPLCGRACDHYNRFESDFDLVKQLGQNAHRFSIEWARIEPLEGKFDEKEIEHYRSVLRALKARGITPMVTLWHFTLPLWFSSRGGFLHKDAPEIFARYCAYVIERLGGEADLWVTINEPQIISTNGYIRGKFPPFSTNLFSAIRVTHKMAAAHRTAYSTMKKIRPDIHIGIATHNNYFDTSKSPLMRPIAALLSFLRNRWFLDLVLGYQDFIGLNHYIHNPIGWRVAKNVVRSDMNWEVHPESMYRCLMELKQYKVPIYITENGIADGEDTRRADYIRGYLGAVHKAIQDGVDVRGYFHWSLMDNYEWAEGFTKRFGLIEINYETLARIVRPSAHVYAAICKNNALPMGPAPR